MRVLLDDCVPARFSQSLVGHDCVTVASARLAEMKNGELLAAAERLGFELFITIDQGIVYQVNLSGRNIAILVLRPKTSRLFDLLPLASECLAQMRTITPGDLRIISS